MPPIAIAAGIGAIGSIGGGLIASSGAKSAANTQAQAADYAAQLQSQDANKALDFSKQQFGTQQAELAPYLQSGYGALANLNNLLGLPNSKDQLYNPYSAQGQTATPTAGNAGTINPNVPQYIPGPHGSDMPNPAYYAQQRRSTITAAPQGQGNSLASLVNPSLGATGSLNQGWNQTFQAPKNVTEQNDPGYQFRLQQGQLALERSAAAKGNLLTGGTAKDLTDYAQGAASNEYQNVYNRALEGYQTNYNTFQNNQANQYNRLASLAGLGQTTAGQLGSLGGQAAGNVSNILLNSGQQVGNSLQNAGSARATGYANTGNILGNSLGSIGSNIGNLYMLQSLLGHGGGSNLGTLGAQDIGNQPFTLS